MIRRVSELDWGQVSSSVTYNIVKDQFSLNILTKTKTVLYQAQQATIT